LELKFEFNYSNRNSNAKQWAIGKKQFNENPKEVNILNNLFYYFQIFFQGFRWLVENNLIQNTPEHMAAFLINETGLSKRAIGEYLGEKYFYLNYI